MKYEYQVRFVVYVRNSQTLFSYIPEGDVRNQSISDRWTGGVETPVSPTVQTATAALP